MMTKSKASPGGPRPLQLLVVGKGKQAGVLEQFVRTQTELTQTSVDQADDFENAQVKLAERVYDLVLFAQDEPETQTARMIQELQLQGKRMPLLFLPGTLAHGPGVKSHGDAASHAAESALIRTIRGAVALGRGEQQEVARDQVHEPDDELHLAHHVTADPRQRAPLVDPEVVVEESARSLQDQAVDDEERADDVEGNELRESHAADSRDYRRERPNDRHELG